MENSLCEGQSGGWESNSEATAITHGRDTRGQVCIYCGGVAKLSGSGHIFGAAQRLAEGMCVGCEREAGSARTSRSGLSKYRRELPSVELNRAVGICAFFWVEFSGATLGGSYLYQHLLLASAGQKRRKRIMFVEGLIFTSHYWVVYYA